MKTTILLDQEPYSPQGYIVRALLKIEGAAPTSSNRTPLNLAIVLDRSGSMGGEKLHAAREAAALLVQRLAPEDVVHVVAYDTGVRTVDPSQIRDIQPGGSTNLSGGWLKGRDHVAHNVRPNTANRVVLLTDGLANVGIQDPAQLAGLCATANEHGIRTTTIGFGTDYDEHLLTRMAEAGGGNMHYIEHADQAPAIFAEEIDGLLSLSAQNLTLSVIPAAGTHAVAVHHSYPRRETADGLQLELGDLYAREPKLVLLEFVIDATSSEEIHVAKLVLEAAVLLENGAVEQQEIMLTVTTSLVNGPVSNPEVRRELLLLEAARLRTEVLEDQANGRSDVAREKLRAMSNKLREAGIDDAQVQEEAADFMIMADHIEMNSFGVAEQKYMHQRAFDSTRAMRVKSEAISRAKRKRDS